MLYGKFSSLPVLPRGMPRFSSGFSVVPVMLAVAGLFLDAVAEAVERRFYPGLPPARGASCVAAVIDVVHVDTTVSR